jgi:hypothetical protein
VRKEGKKALLARALGTLERAFSFGASEDPNADTQVFALGPYSFF